MKDDAPILDRVQASPRDEKLWAELFHHLHPRVYMLAYRLCAGDTALAEDLTQEAFLRFIRYQVFSRLTSETAAVGYLRAILRNVVNDHYRKAGQIQTVPLDDLPPDDSRRLDATAVVHFTDEEISILEGLDADEQRLLRLVAEGWSLGEIAEKMGLGYSACAVRLHRVKKKLRGV